MHAAVAAAGPAEALVVVLFLTVAVAVLSVCFQSGVRGWSSGRRSGWGVFSRSKGPSKH